MEKGISEAVGFVCKPYCFFAWIKELFSFWNLIGVYALHKGEILKQIEVIREKTARIIQECRSFHKRLKE